MISLVSSINQNPRALKAALLSTLPGLGQLFNRRLDKAIAFFLVDLANLGLILVLSGIKIPYLPVNWDSWVQHLSSWRAGTAPFCIVQLMLLAYVLYAQFDAFRDAQRSEQLSQKPELCLSHTTCASYLLHLSSIFALFLAILFKITPDIHPELTQISLSFELAQPELQQPAENKKNGIEANLKEDPTAQDSAHLKDKQKSEELNPSTASTEMAALVENENRMFKKTAAEETEAVASKQIVTPESKQSPREVLSNGASQKAVEASQQKNEEIEAQKSAPAEAAASQKAATKTDSPESTISNDTDRALPEKHTLLALTTPSAAAANGMSKQVDSSAKDTENGKIAPALAATTLSEGTGAPKVSLSASNLSGAGTAAGAATVRDYHYRANLVESNTVIPASAPVTPQLLVPGVIASSATLASQGAPVAITLSNPSSITPQNVNSLPAATASIVLGVPGTTNPYDNHQGPTAGASADSNQQSGAPSMLGFMDSTLSTDPDMRQLWSEMSGNISRFVKEHPLEDEGMAINTFTLNKYGQPINVQMAPTNSKLAASLSDTLAKMPRVTPPADQLDKMFFQVKASKDANGTFISLEVNSQPSPISSESLSDFKYQTNLQAYLKGIKKAIYSSWKPPVQEGVKPVMVGFKVTTDGVVKEQHVVQSSGDPKMDKAALNAALSITRWSQPPSGTAEDLDVCMVIQKCKSCESQSGSSPAKVGATLAPGGRILHSTERPVWPVLYDAR